jgi:hypothetical protein
VNPFVLGLRAEPGGAQTAERTVLALFSDLSAGRIDAARARTASDFSWFGKPMGDAEWAGEKLRAFLEVPLAADAPRSLARATLEAMPAYAVDRAFGSIDKADRVVFTDVTRGGLTTTVAAVVASGSGDTPPRVRRVVDPEAFVRFVEYAAVLHHLPGDA